MPTGERRYYLGRLIKDKQEEEERVEEMKNKTSGGKGTRKTKVSGQALKNKIKSGEITP